MAVTYTSKLGLSQAAKGDLVGTWIDVWNQDNSRLEARLASTYAGDPNDNLAGSFVGQQCFDTTNNKIYFCTTVGDAATAVWQSLTEMLGITFYALAPSGTILVWDQDDAAIPSGWSIYTGIANKVLGLVETEAAALTTHGANTVTPTMNTAGAHTHGGATQSHTLTTDQIPNHSHSGVVTASSTNSVANTGSGTSALDGASVSGSTSSAGGGQGHTHNISSDGDHTHTMNSVDNRPATVNFRLIIKD
jgi:hypothetical protein